MSALSMGPALCLVGTIRSPPELGTNGSPSVMTVLCPLWSVLMVLCPCWSMWTVLSPLRSVMLVLCPMGWEDEAQVSWEEAMGSM